MRYNDDVDSTKFHQLHAICAEPLDCLPHADPDHPCHQHSCHPNETISRPKLALPYSPLYQIYPISSESHWYHMSQNIVDRSPHPQMLCYIISVQTPNYSPHLFDIVETKPDVAGLDSTSIFSGDKKLYYIAPVAHPRSKHTVSIFPAGMFSVTYLTTRNGLFLQATAKPIHPAQSPAPSNPPIQAVTNQTQPTEQQNSMRFDFTREAMVVRPPLDIDIFFKP
jgi:hypothetical protein